MEIKLDDNAIRQAVNEAILRSLDDAKRETLIGAAIKTLLDAPIKNNSYGERSMAPIQRIFEEEVYQFARKSIQQKLDFDGAFKARLAKIMSDALDKAFSEDNSELLNNITKLMTESLKPKERY